MKEANYYEEIAEGPKHARAYWIQTSDDVRLRIGTYHGEGKIHGTILLMLGRFGYIERYGRVAQLFAEQGFSTVVVDWRGQGLSDRLATDRQAGHIREFSDYQNDVDAMMRAAKTLDLPKPYFLVGVSMGACIGLRTMMDGLPVIGAAFISPMWGIKMSPLQRIAAWPLSWAAKMSGFGHRYIPGESGGVYVLETPFEDNNLTHNSDMYTYWVYQAKKAPELQIGGPTLTWLFEALAECRRLSRAPSPNTPCITFCGELDQLVDNASIKARMANWPNGEFVMIQNAKHDVLTEVPEIGGDVANQISDFFKKVKTTA